VLIILEISSGEVGEKKKRVGILIPEIFVKVLTSSGLIVIVDLTLSATDVKKSLKQLTKK